jgi:hypothetical protein
MTMTKKTSVDGEHRWSGWPGAICLDCGASDALEYCAANCDIFERCACDAGCDRCRGTGCLPVPCPDHVTPPCSQREEILTVDEREAKLIELVALSEAMGGYREIGSHAAVTERKPLAPAKSIHTLNQMTYQFPTWWGGVAQSDAPPQISQAIQQLRQKVGGLEAKKQDGPRVPRFPIKSGKELMIKLRDALDELGMVALTVSLTGGNIPLGQDSDGDSIEGTLAFLMSTVRLGCQDGSYVDVVGAGHGADSQDKAGGKASSYAWKDALVKGLSLPDAQMVDTDDEETPIPGLKQGKKAKPAKAAPTPPAAESVTKESAAQLIAEASDEAALKAALQVAKTLPPAEQAELAAAYKAKKAALAA